MNYLILHEGKAFYTNWYDFENNYIKGMVIFNLLSHEFTHDGVIWNKIEQDHL